MLTQQSPEVLALLREYYEIQKELQALMTRKLTRKHKIGHARQVEILKELTKLRPGNDPQALVDDYIKNFSAV